MARAVASFDWASTPLGAIADWPTELRTTVSLMMGTDYAAAIWWGPEFVLIHNQHYQDELLTDRGKCLGRKFDDIWPDVAHFVRPQLDAVLASGIGESWSDVRIEFVRDNAPVETFWNYSFTPVLASDGSAVGLYNGAVETTATVQRDRANALVIALDEQLLTAPSIDAMIDAALTLIGQGLNAERTGFGEIDLTSRSLDIRQCWSTAAMPDITGRYPLGTFGHISEELAAGRPVLIEDNRTDPRTAESATVAMYERIGLRSGIVIPIIDRGQYAGGVFVQTSSPRRWLPHEVGLAEAASRRLWQALVRARSEIALRESEQRYRLIFEQADDIIFTADIDQRITDANAAGLSALGLERDALIGRSIADFVSPTDFAQTTAMLRHKIDHGGNTRHEVSVVGRDGRTMRWDNNSTLVVDRDGKPIGLLSISRDVSERRAFDERRELLINELNHRVKNTLALVQAIAVQTFPRGAAQGGLRDEFIARLHTLAGAHDLLTREHWEGVTLAELVHAATAPIDRHHSRIAATGPDLRITPKAAVAIAMALHELGTNAVKYGALSVQVGRVDVGWHSDEAQLVIVWRERGGPPVTPPERTGFGMRMIERVLASDLGGHVSLDFSAQGLQCTIEASAKGNLA